MHANLIINSQNNVNSTIKIFVFLDNKESKLPLSNTGCLHCRQLKTQDFQGQD
jgi:hypothetical protein